MKIVFTAKGKDWNSMMDSRFGRAENFVLYNEETKELTTFENNDVANEAHGAGPKAAQKISELKANVLITGNGPGEKANAVMQQLGIKCYVGAGDMSIKDAYEAYKNGKLNQF